MALTSIYVVAVPAARQVDDKLAKRGMKDRYIPMTPRGDMDFYC